MAINLSRQYLTIRKSYFPVIEQAVSTLPSPRVDALLADVIADVILNLPVRETGKVPADFNRAMESALHNHDLAAMTELGQRGLNLNSSLPLSPSFISACLGAIRLADSTTPEIKCLRVLGTLGGVRLRPEVTMREIYKYRYAPSGVQVPKVGATQG